MRRQDEERTYGDFRRPVHQGRFGKNVLAYSRCFLLKQPRQKKTTRKPKIKNTGQGDRSLKEETCCSVRADDEVINYLLHLRFFDGRKMIRRPVQSVMLGLARLVPGCVYHVCI